MAAQIYALPEGFDEKVPKLDFTNFNLQEHNKKEEDFIEELRQWHFDNGFNGKHAGEVIRFGVADGYALYMVSKLRPLQLVHLPLGDAYNFQYAHLLTASEVSKQIEGRKRFEERWNKS